MPPFRLNPRAKQRSEGLQDGRKCRNCNELAEIRPEVPTRNVWTGGKAKLSNDNDLQNDGKRVLRGPYIFQPTATTGPEGLRKCYNSQNLSLQRRVIKKFVVGVGF